MFLEDRKDRRGIVIQINVSRTKEVVGKKEMD
jgi:hypothetical protein